MKFHGESEEYFVRTCQSITLSMHISHCPAALPDEILTQDDSHGLEQIKKMNIQTMLMVGSVAARHHKRFDICETVAEILRSIGIGF